MLDAKFVTQTDGTQNTDGTTLVLYWIAIVDRSIRGSSFDISARKEVSGPKTILVIFYYFLAQTYFCKHFLFDKGSFRFLLIYYGTPYTLNSYWEAVQIK